MVAGICRMAFDGCPPDSKFPGDDSPVVWGQCGHAFHLQCITKWCVVSIAQSLQKRAKTFYQPRGARALFPPAGCRAKRSSAVRSVAAPGSLKRPPPPQPAPPLLLASLRGTSMVPLVPRRPASPPALIILVSPMHTVVTDEYRRSCMSLRMGGKP